MSGFLEREADNWWHAESPDRRIQIYQWVTGRKAGGHPEVEGQQQLPMRIRE